MTNPQDLLGYLGTDSRRWAAEFCKSARDKGLRYDEDLMRGWFSQAIMAGRVEGQNCVAAEMRERAAQKAAHYEAPIWSAMIAAAIRALPLKAG